MSGYITYGVTRTFGCSTYSNSGYESRESALENVYERAFEDGNWSPRPLRERWWQFWLPKEHDEIEARFVGRDRP